MNYNKMEPIFRYEYMTVSGGNQSSIKNIIMLRMMNGSALKDHITSESLLTKYKLPAVNQLAAEIKIIEA